MALEDGYLNEEISVMNLASSKKLKGIVLSSGVVEIR
jgi:flagella basal body P-ring formation protein FlgA